jgi:hypothetical protein
MFVPFRSGIGLLGLGLSAFLVPSAEAACSDITGTGGGGSIPCPQNRQFTPPSGGGEGGGGGGSSGVDIGAATGAAAAIFGALGAMNSGRAEVAVPPPPASCVNKFVGAWQTKVRMTGQTYRSDVFANGWLKSGNYNPQTWTCQGDTFILTSPVRIEQNLTPDGQQMVGRCCIGTRWESVAAVEAAQKAAAKTDNTGSARWLPPGSAKPAEPKAAVKLPRGAPAAVHMGNLPVAGLGLSRQRQRDLDALASDSKSVELYIRKLSQQEQTAARAYLKTAARGGSAGTAVTNCKEAEAYINSLIQRGTDVRTISKSVAAACPNVPRGSSPDPDRLRRAALMPECKPGWFLASPGYGKERKCQPYGQGSPGAAPRLHQSDITGTNR